MTAIYVVVALEPLQGLWWSERNISSNILVCRLEYESAYEMYASVIATLREGHNRYTLRRMLRVNVEEKFFLEHVRTIHAIGICRSVIG